MRFSTTSLARACSRHPGRTLAAWGAVLVGSIVALMFALTGFTTEATATNNPESERADERLTTAFPPDPQQAVSDVVIVRSTSLTVTDAGFRTFVDGLVKTGRDSGAVLNAITYYDTNDSSLVSADRHATLVPINV